MGVLRLGCFGGYPVEFLVKPMSVPDGNRIATMLLNLRDNEALEFERSWDRTAVIGIVFLPFYISIGFFISCNPVIARRPQ